MVRYDKTKDILTVIVRPLRNETFEFEGGGITAIVDEEDVLVEVTIANASRFVAEALAAGVKADAGPAEKSKKSGLVWYDADSSMISAFGYNEAEQVLEIAFHNTGVYRYYDVPKKVFAELRDASSKGSYIRDMIIDMYPYEKKRGRSHR